MIKKIVILTLLMLFLNVSGFVYGIDLVIEGALSEKFDDNINASENREADFITEATVGLGLKAEARSYDVNILGHIFQQIYVLNSGKNYTAQDIVLTVNKYMSERYRINIRNTFQNYPEPRDFAGVFGRDADRDGYIANNLSIINNYVLYRDLTIDVTYLNQYVNNIDEDLTDSITHDGGIKVTYFLSSRNSTQWSYNFNYISYDNGYENREHRGSLRLGHFFTKQLSAYGLIGGNYLTSDTGNTYLNPFFECGVTDDIDENNKLSLIFSKEVGTTQQAENPFDNWQVSLQYARQLLDRLRTDVRCFYGQGKLIEEEADDTENSLLGVNLVVAYLLTPESRGQLEYIFTKSDTYLGGEHQTGYTRNQITISVLAEF